MTSEADDRSRPRTAWRRQSRLRSLMVAVAVMAIGFGALRDPEVGPFVRIFAMIVVAGLASLLILAVATVVVLLVAMALACVGFGLLALFDRFVPGSQSPTLKSPRPATNGPGPERARER
jgi:hypothetical protein